MKKLICANIALLFGQIPANEILWKDDLGTLQTISLETGSSQELNGKSPISNNTILNSSKEKHHFLSLDGKIKVDLFEKSSLKVFKKKNSYLLTLIKGKMDIQADSMETELWLKHTKVKLVQGSISVDEKYERMVQLKSGEAEVLNNSTGLFERETYKGEK